LRGYLKVHKFFGGGAMVSNVSPEMRRAAHTP
jgi:hypothetical protein